MAVYESLKMLFFYITFLWCFCSARDTIRQGDLIRDDRGRQTLVSAGGMFELGFFTPRGSTDGKRYVGIWYHKLSPQTVVWVANRKDPVVNSRSRGIVFGITEDGNLKMFDSTSGTAEPYWSSGLASTLSASNRTVTLLDSGNLVLTGYNDELGKITRLWESFEDPTDTFLPGMKMEYEKFTLTSWKDQADPGLGDFRFKIAEGMNQFVIMNKSLTYWKSGEPDKFFSSNKMPRVIVNVLSNFSNGPKCMNTICADSSKKVIPPLSDYSYTRLVINYTGQVVYKNWDKVLSVWTTGWSEPSDRCSVFNVCGSLGICSNDKKRLACTCLPGLKPSLPDKWNFGDYSDGCTRGTKLCSGENETFLSLKIVNVGNPDSTGLPVNNETECRKECFDNCRCQAYSFQASDQKIWQRGNYSPPTDVCWTWFENLIDLQEGNTIGGGHNLFARVALSDLKGRNPQPSKGELLRARMPLFWIVLATVISIIVLSCATISYAIWRRKMAKRGGKGLIWYILHEKMRPFNRNYCM
ncbi:S-locus glycoprotein [Parasponia andersonii]|uniref:S-locus glycoprotein n=1 Tax=Parasponia andersonii TaxID=3476 RepID=A0A2P5E4M4_PARAD|nr:S-locus glycoprotein [Parasponia andersonii]